MLLIFRMYLHNIQQLFQTFMPTQIKSYTIKSIEIYKRNHSALLEDSTATMETMLLFSHQYIRG